MLVFLFFLRINLTINVAHPVFLMHTQSLLSGYAPDFDPLSNIPVIFLFSPGKMLLTMFLFQKWLVALFLKMSEPVTLDALTPASVHSLWSSPNRLCLTVFSSLLSSLLLEHIFLSNFFLPVFFSFNILWYSTPWTATPFNNDPLCRRCQWSSSGPLPSQQSYPLLWFQRTRYTPNLNCMDSHLMKLKCKYSDILRYWIFDFR